jgi:hypothetical protein
MQALVTQHGMLLSRSASHMQVSVHSAARRSASSTYRWHDHVEQTFDQRLGQREVRTLDLPLQR